MKQISLAAFSNNQNGGLSTWVEWAHVEFGMGCDSPHICPAIQPCHNAFWAHLDYCSNPHSGQSDNFGK